MFRDGRNQGIHLFLSIQPRQDFSLQAAVSIYQVMTIAITEARKKKNEPLLPKCLLQHFDPPHHVGLESFKCSFFTFQRSNACLSTTFQFQYELMSADHEFFALNVPFGAVDFHPPPLGLQKVHDHGETEGLCAPIAGQLWCHHKCCVW